MATFERELPALYDCEIVEAQTRDMVFRLCKTCKGKVVLVAQDPHKGKEAFYCPKCDVLNPTCTANLKLKIKIRQGNQLDNLEVYENVLLPLLGCSIDDLLMYIETLPDFLVRLEFLLVGKVFDIVLRPKKKQVMAMEPQRPDLFPLVAAPCPIMLPTLRRGYATARAWTYAQASEWLAQFDKTKIPSDQLRIQFSRSSGPGGQNVNKVSTKVDMRLMRVRQSPWLPEYARQKIQVNKAGDLQVTSDRTRSQQKNIDECYAKLVETIKAAVAVPREPDAATQQRVNSLREKEDARRKDKKQRQSQKKQSRRSKGDDY